MSKVKFATVWLDGCSGCHMSFLDIDERLIELADKIELVYSPLVDNKEFPEDVDITLVEGSVSSEDDLHKIRMVRERTKILAAFGDCAVNGNVPGMRNLFGVEPTLKRGYYENVTLNPQTPHRLVPALLQTVKPLHAVVPVDLYLQGCPPTADAIYKALAGILANREAEL